MPSIEIICISQTKPIYLTDLPFQIEVSQELISHRSPSPIFQSDFDKLNGYIYHLLDNEGITAYGLLEKGWYDTYGNSNVLKFIEEIAPCVRSFFETLLNFSPAKQLLFTSDYQFGPELAKRFAPISISEFWKLHDTNKLRINSAYWIIEN